MPGQELYVILPEESSLEEARGAAGGGFGTSEIKRAKKQGPSRGEGSCCCFDGEDYSSSRAPVYSW